MSEDLSRNLDEIMEDNNDSEVFELGLENEGLMNAEGNGNRGEDEVNSGIMPGFDQMALPFRWVNMDLDLDLDLNFAIGDGPSSSSGTPFLSNSLDRGDLHNKRPKVNISPLDWGSRLQEGPTSVFEDGSTSDLTGYGDSLNNGEGTDCIPTQAEDREVSMDFSDDLLHQVFSFLVHMDLCRAAGVCRQWRKATSHEDFWRSLNFKNKRITLQQFEDICRRYPNATAVNIFGTPNVNSLVIQAISLLRNLEVLSLGKVLLKESAFQAFSESHMLRSLTINGAIFASGVLEIPVHHERLRVLQILKCRVTRVSIRCPLLESLSLRRSSMPLLALTSPLLKNLDIAACHKLSDATIRSTVISCPLLESLNMANCSCVTNDTLREIALACASLHILDASYCPNIFLENVRLPMLTVLKLNSCEGINSASMAAISRSYMLETLELDNCSSLISVSLDLPCLKNIRLVHCRKFVDLNLRSGMLSSITVSNCPYLQRINIISSMLKKLVLQKQQSLTTLALHCQCLEEVDLTECEALTNSICEVFCDGGGCPVLKSLVLDNCESLTAVELSSSSILNLSLAGCRAITSLILKCPSLEQVSLDGCDHLERASFCPVALRSLNLGICPKLNVLDVEAPQMSSLELKGCGLLSEASIYCPQLTSLDASFCSQLKDDCLSATVSSCARIESLVLMSCPSAGTDGLVSLQWLSSLTYLDLSYTFLVDLRPIFNSCTRLKVLKLQACKYLADSSLEPLYKEGVLPGLCELDLSYGTMCRMAIEELLACCTHLTHVSLNGCINMHDIEWDFKVDLRPEMSSGKLSIDSSSLDDINFSNSRPKRLLQHLNCVGCSNIKKVVIPPAAGCSYLSSLNLSLSANLKEVDVACCNLSYLNMSNCSSLEILKLDCPRLTSLFLQGCKIGVDAVEAAISRCSMLETLDVRFCSKIYPTMLARLRSACPSLKRVYNSQLAL